MNILIINYFYYPMVDAHVYKWMAIENELIKLGHNVDFIHSSFNNDEENKNIKTVSLVIIFKKISQFLKNKSYYIWRIQARSATLIN